MTALWKVVAVQVVALFALAGVAALWSEKAAVSSALGGVCGVLINSIFAWQGGRRSQPVAVLVLKRLYRAVLIRWLLLMVIVAGMLSLPGIVPEWLLMGVIANLALGMVAAIGMGVVK